MDKFGKKDFGRVCKISLMVVLGVLFVCSFRVLWTEFGLIDMGKNPWSLITGLAAAPALLLTWYWRDQAKRKDIEQKDKDIEIAQESQLTERFATAVKLLGDDKRSICLGGIYALERLAKDSINDHWSIMETLSAFIRDNASWPPAENEDETEEAKDTTESSTPAPKKDSETKTSRITIQAALSVIGRRSKEGIEYEEEHSYQIDLSKSDLNGLNLRKAHLEGANLSGAHLDGANLYGANLKKAHLIKAHLDGAFLREAHLEGANLMRAHLEGAFLREAHLEGANLIGAHLEGANLYEAHLEGADLREAHLEGADLEGAKYNSKVIGEGEFSIFPTIFPTIFPEGFKAEEHPEMIDTSEQTNKKQ